MAHLNGPILVTGAAGYLASWIVAQLLAEHIEVRGTVRSLADADKLHHLHELSAKYPGQLRLYEADLMKEGSFDEATHGCSVVIHTASPYFLSPPKNVELDLLAPARQGTLNLLGSVNRTPSVRRVVLTASVASLYNNARDLADRPSRTVQENDRNLNDNPRHNPYAYSKTAAEKAAWEVQRAQSCWDLITIHPGAIFGPALSRRTDATSVGMMLQFLNGSFKAGVPRLWLGVVDVRDAAAVHVRAALFPNASGRYIAVGDSLTLLEIAQTMRPDDFGLPDKLPKREASKPLIWIIAPFIGMTRHYVSANVNHPIFFNNERSITELNLRYRNAAETLNEHIRQIVEDHLIEA